MPCNLQGARNELISNHFMDWFLFEKKEKILFCNRVRYSVSAPGERPPSTVPPPGQGGRPAAATPPCTANLPARLLVSVSVPGAGQSRRFKRRELTVLHGF